jgi:hypothetical protein
MVRTRGRRQQQINRTKIITNDPNVRLHQGCEIAWIEPRVREIGPIHRSGDRPHVESRDDLDTSSRRAE